ncbi:3-oxoacyl-ACP synthase [Halorubrum ezzemoulense]|uniref:3-oxoacyl-ACP synthase n=1 Tax=Halorubrum ezzemoulense TaxID=337243 RepID=A0ABT4YZ54_HALEZ|nr:3-oxoacyl-ACP synthase [Halorubrum ezzemoulense]MDB2243267.1 3-oxoacyl-ACP synthase [Halorubrum ezzemoulense]MDB2251337.1 3-oxoacyl-ACP synthase [Halorubrum ezzemoulense]MDB2277002.1 3-oxoacyl-ACP synthase [Halorubrum ezzemoulense]MDB2283726.1 3-oxoacyl-ACP synthase [Halorubrum ezzemoulense]MDB2288629.1 3-oxoacyl-ACP synthase [Halorubrum ezzemoulense]
MTVSITGLGTYVPDETITGEAIAAESGIPEEVVVEKMGVREKHVCPPDDDHATDMSVTAAERALADADVDPADLDVVVYHGSEYKDHVVWSAAAAITDRLGATNAYATESYTLCAGAPIALRQVTAQLETEPIDTALLVAASREEDLVDYGNEDSSFMFNFGSGASAFVVEATDGGSVNDEADRFDGRARATVRASAAQTDGSFAGDVVMPAGGSKRPPSEETVREGLHTLDVPDPDGMKERLGPVSLPAYLSVADTALERSGFDRDDLDFVALTHMKRSFHERVLDELGLDPRSDGYYLDEFGHVQSVDQALALERGVETERLEPGDLGCLLAAGTGYTWSATVIRWRG